MKSLADGVCGENLVEVCTSWLQLNDDEEVGIEQVDLCSTANTQPETTQQTMMQTSTDAPQITNKSALIPTTPAVVDENNLNGTISKMVDTLFAKLSRN